MPEEEIRKNRDIEIDEDNIRHSLERAIAAQLVLTRKFLSADTTIPMPKQGYTDSAIKKFVDDTIEITDSFSEKKKNKIRSLYVKILSEFPPWQQAFIIENHQRATFGTLNDIHQLNNDKSRKTIGFFREYDSAYVSVSNPELVHSITSHEMGHRFDYDGSDYTSDKSDKWKEALEREKRNGWRGEAALAEINPERTISRHLTLGYKPSEFPREAMAEMTSIYNQAYRKFGGDAKKTNELMAKAYPELFPVYRDEFIPRIVGKVTSISENITNEKLADEKNIVINDITEINLNHSPVKEIDFPNSDGTASKRKAIESHYLFSDRSLNEAKSVLKSHGIDVTFVDIDLKNPSNYKQYLVFNNDADAAKFAALRESGELFKYPATEIPKYTQSVEYIKNAGKTLGAMLPTNIDNIIIASVFGAATAGMGMVMGADIPHATKVGFETGKEISGFGAAERSWESGKGGDNTEAGLQAIDALGIPVVAVRDGMKGVKITIEKEQDFALLLSSFLPKNLKEARNSVPIINDPMVKDIMEKYVRVLSLKNQTEMDPYNTQLSLELNRAEGDFAKSVRPSIENPPIAKATLIELQRVKNIRESAKQAENIPDMELSSSYRGIGNPLQAGITPT